MGLGATPKLVIALVLAGTAALAEAPEAAGRLEGPKGPLEGTCSGVLIAPDLVATAGHCKGGNGVFRPGGSASDTYQMAARAEHPLYNLPGQGNRRFRFDLSLARLAAEVPSEIAEPLPVGPEPEIGEILVIASWRAGPTDRAVEKPCPVVPGKDGIVTLGCDVRNGESGAPVLRETADGFEVVAIVTSRTRLGILPVAQAATLQGRIAPMLAALPK